MKKNLILTVALCLFISMNTLAKTYDITSYGAIPDGKTIATQAINKAVTACNAAGGGTVLVPAGTFLTGRSS